MCNLSNLSSITSRNSWIVDDSTTRDTNTDCDFACWYNGGFWTGISSTVETFGIDCWLPFDDEFDTVEIVYPVGFV